MMAGLVVFCCPQVLFQIPPITFTKEEYASLCFVYGSCDGMVEMHQWNTSTAIQVVEFTLEHIL